MLCGSAKVNENVQSSATSNIRLSNNEKERLLRAKKGNLSYLDKWPVSHHTYDGKSSKNEVIKTKCPASTIP